MTVAKSSIPNQGRKEIEQKDKSAVYVPLIRDLRSTHLHSLIQIFVH